MFPFAATPSLHIAITQPSLCNKQFSSPHNRCIIITETKQIPLDDNHSIYRSKLFDVENNNIAVIEMCFLFGNLIEINLIKSVG
ncbi:hypothetical protein T03_3692 [Trichinella britovi]|uniref:Uncharacterized protein n=1 Tax=Trichinella britovi TaxID=45882 RepID=A0A0V1D0A2_TRIBR|nr:hypothetical protein T03_3692 [Trichinella britovi]